MKNNRINRDQNGDEELEGQAPALAGIQKDLASGQLANPFSVPDGYFDSLHAEVVHKIESLPDFESSASGNPFKVPAGYFESLPAIIQQRIIDEKAEGFSVSVWIAGVLARPAPKYAFAFAALALLLLFSTLYYTRTVKVEYATQQVPESEQQDADLLMFLDEADLADLYAQETSARKEVQDEGMENYLMDNDIDMNSITDQL